MGLGFGLGIGLQAKPKDYAELVKARESAKQKAIATKAAKDADKAQKLYEKWYFRNINNSYLPFQQEMAKDVVLELIDVFEKEGEKDTPDMTLLNTAVASAENKLQNLVLQKKTADKFYQNPNAFGFGTEEIQAIYSEPDKNNVSNIIQEKGVGIAYDPNTNLIQFRTVGDFDKQNVPSQLKNYFDSVGDKVFDPNNLKAEIQVADTKYRYTGVAAQAKDYWLNSALINPGSAREFEFVYKAQNKKLPDFNDPNVQAEFKEYLSNKYDDYIEPLVVAKGGGKRAQTNFITPAEKKEKQEYLRTGGVTYPAGTTGTDSYETFGEFGGKQISVTTDIPSGTVDVNNLQPYTGGGKTINYSKFGVYPVKPDNSLAIKSVYGSGYPRKLAVGVFATTERGQGLVITNPTTRRSALQSMTRDEKSNLMDIDKEFEAAVNYYNSLTDEGKRSIWMKYRPTYPDIVDAVKAYKEAGMD
jgi:hypothetical protein